MKKESVLILIVAAVMGMSSCTSSHRGELKTEVDTLSYYFGMARADGIMNYLVYQAGVDTTYMDAFYKGFKDGVKNYSPEDMAYLEGMRIAQMANNQWVDGLNKDIFMGDSGKTINRKAMIAGFYHGLKSADDMNIMRAQSISQAKIEEMRERYKHEKYAESIAANETFLVENKKKDGVQTLESGLQYRIITEGTGAIPDERAKVKVNYRGTLIDGTEFDRSKDNIPTSFRVNQVIKGWTEALLLMPVGSKWELYIPQDLAYGSRQQNNIPPYSTLIFEVELLEIEPQ